ncbi:MAG: hypothetical protein QOE76_2873 [Frankiales bacterium]|nr:hypothetical protein [Frankiales bacterium]
MCSTVRSTAARVLATTMLLPFLVAAPGTATAGPPGELVIPSTFGAPEAQAYITAPLKLMASGEGIAYEHGLDFSAHDGVLLRPTGSVAVAPVQLQALVSVVGDQLLGYSYDLPSRLTSVSIHTGERQTLEEYAGNPSQPEADPPRPTLTGTGTGWLDATIGGASTPDTLTLRALSGAPARTYPLPQAGLHARRPVADDRGLLTSLASSSGSSSLGYLDFASGTWTMLPMGDRAVFAMSSRDLGWVSHGVLNRVHRTAPADAPETRTVSTSTIGLAITDTASAWVVASDAGAQGQLVTAAEPATTPETAVVAPLSVGLNTVVAMGNDGFAASFGGGTAADGVYPVAAGATQPAGLLQPTAYGPVQELQLSPGQQVFRADQNYAQRLSLLNGQVAAGPALAAGPAERVATNGGWTVLKTWSGAQVLLTVTGLWGKPLVIPVPTATYAVVLSGSHLLVTDSVDITGQGPTQAHSTLYDLSRPGINATAVPGTSALSGHWLAYTLHDGSVWLRDLALPRTPDRQLRGPGPAPADVRDYTSLLISGDWVVWDAQPVAGVTSYAAAFRISTGLTTRLNLPGTAQALTDGLLAYVDGTTGLHLLSLATGADQLVGHTSAPIALSGEFLAYIGEDNAEHLVPVAALDPTGPRAVLSGGDPSPRTKPVTSVHPLVESFATSRPLTSWAFTIRNSKGKVVFRTKGTAPTGWVSVRWNGRASKGKRLPAGGYRWTLTGAGPGGALVGQDGRGRVSGLVGIGR